eukprot:3941822-Lingulodinium_polyedra.AAC.1
MPEPWVIAGWCISAKPLNSLAQCPSSAPPRWPVNSPEDLQKRSLDSAAQSKSPPMMVSA